MPRNFICPETCAPCVEEGCCLANGTRAGRCIERETQPVTRMQLEAAKHQQQALEALWRTKRAYEAFDREFKALLRRWDPIVAGLVRAEAYQYFRKNGVFRDTDEDREFRQTYLRAEEEFVREAMRLQTKHGCVLSARSEQ